MDCECGGHQVGPIPAIWIVSVMVINLGPISAIWIVSVMVIRWVPDLPYGL